MNVLSPVHVTGAKRSEAISARVTVTVPSPSWTSRTNIRPTHPLDPALVDERREVVGEGGLLRGRGLLRGAGLVAGAPRERCQRQQHRGGQTGENLADRRTW